MRTLQEGSPATLDAYLWQDSGKGQLETDGLAHFILFEKHKDA